MFKEKSTNSDNIVEIINGCRNNETICKSKLYESYYYIVLNVCKQYTKTLPEAEDLTQDIFLKLFDKISGFNGNSIGKFTNWVKMLTKNHAIDIIRGSKNLLTIDDVKSGFPYTEIDIDSIDKIKDSIDDTINECINKLSPSLKEVIILYYFKNYSHKQIADKLDIHEGTSKSNLFKAKKKLSKMLMHYNDYFINN
jgi:RNA polymerase sigma factor (sigma-70 family)